MQSQFVPRGTESPSAATDHCGWLAVASDDVEHPAVNEASADQARQRTSRPADAHSASLGIMCV